MSHSAELTVGSVAAAADLQLEVVALALAAPLARLAVVPAADIYLHHLHSGRRQPGRQAAGQRRAAEGQPGVRRKSAQAGSTRAARAAGLSRRRSGPQPPAAAEQHPPCLHSESHKTWQSSWSRTAQLAAWSSHQPGESTAGINQGNQPEESTGGINQRNQPEESTRGINQGESTGGINQGNPLTLTGSPPGPRTSPSTSGPVSPLMLTCSSKTTPRSTCFQNKH